MVDETRTTHVWRQYAKDEDGEDDEDVWLDIQRIDKWISSKGQAEGYQKTTYSLKWEDEDVPMEHPTRDVEMLDVANPEDDEQIVPVPVIKKYRTHNTDQQITHSFVNGEQIETRTYSVRRVYHRDTVTTPPVSGEDYEVLPDTIDEEQYVDVALIESIVTTSGQGETFQKSTYRYNTEPLEQWSVPAPGGFDEDKVVYLDPMQNIINVQWGPEEDPYISIGFRFFVAGVSGDYVYGDHGVTTVGGSPALTPGNPYNSTYTVSVVRHSGWNIGDDFNISPSPPEDEVVAGGTGWAGGGESWYGGPISIGPNNLMSRHFHTPGSLLTGEDGEHPSAQRVPPYTDSLSVEYKMYADQVVAGPFVGYGPDHGLPDGTPGEKLFQTNTGQNDEYATTSFDFSSTTVVYTNPDTAEVKTYRAIGASLAVVEPTAFNKSNGPLYILFKLDPDA